MAIPALSTVEYDEEHAEATFILSCEPVITDLQSRSSQRGSSDPTITVLTAAVLQY